VFDNFFHRKNTAQQKSELERTISHPQLSIPTLRAPVKVGNRTGTAEIPAVRIVSTKSPFDDFFCRAQKIDNVYETVYPNGTFARFSFHRDLRFLFQLEQDSFGMTIALFIYSFFGWPDGFCEHPPASRLRTVGSQTIIRLECALLY
jgi:hypothetical protein